MKLRELLKRAEALPQGPGGVKELLRKCVHWDLDYKRRVCGTIAYHTGLTIHEVWALESEVREEIRRAKYERSKK